MQAVAGAAERHANAVKVGGRAGVGERDTGDAGWGGLGQLFGLRMLSRWVGGGGGRFQGRVVRERSGGREGS